MNIYRKLVFSNPVAGREAEYNDWYDNIHSREAIRDVPGVIAVQRFRLVRSGTRQARDLPMRSYLAIWEVEADNPETAADAFAKAKAEGLIQADETFDLTSVLSGYFEALGPRITATSGFREREVSSIPGTGEGNEA